MCRLSTGQDTVSQAHGLSRHGESSASVPAGPALGGAPDPARALRAVAGRGTGVREQARWPGCVNPHNQRIFTSRPQMVLVGCRHPRAGPLTFGDSAQFIGLAQYAVVSVASADSQVGAGCQPVARAAHLRYYRHSCTRDACRSRLVGLASRAHPRPNKCGQYEQVVSPNPALPPCFPTPSQLTNSLHQCQFNCSVQLVDAPAPATDILVNLRMHKPPQRRHASAQINPKCLVAG